MRLSKLMKEIGRPKDWNYAYNNENHCNSDSPENTYYCTRKPGHFGDHYSYRQDGTCNLKWKR